MRHDAMYAVPNTVRAHTMHDRAASTSRHAHPALAWLDEFAAVVRGRDFDHGRKMFAPEAVGFGTVADRAVGLDTLINTQWRPVWSATRGFIFDLGSAELGGEEPVYWAAAKWSSIGKDATGRDIERRGRATIVLQRRDGKLLAVHSHYSFVPSGAITPPARPQQQPLQ